MNCKYLFLVCWICLGLPGARGDDFFQIESIHYHRNQSNNGEPGVFNESKQLDPKNNTIETIKTFVPYLEAKISVKDQVKSNSVFARVYFFDQSKTQIAKTDAPSVVDWGDGHRYDWLPILPRNQQQTIFFAIPDTVLQQNGWSAVMVFGDAKGVDAQIYPGTDNLGGYNYPEKDLLEDKNGPPIERKPAMDPLVEHAVQTRNPNQPQITLFMRLPADVTDVSQAKGVVCVGVLADQVDGVRRQLQGVDPDNQAMLSFADKHQLIVICWGTTRLWDPTKNWDDLDPEVARNMSKAFDQVADAWAEGVQYFVKEYGIPKDGYLLWGISGSAQFACRLALRKPDYFLAVHAYIPSSFDKPTLEANKVLWCLTTGELESGYQRSLRFYAQCRALGYPIIYKAAPGYGHQGIPVADAVGYQFFEYALTLRDQRLAYDKALSDPLSQPQIGRAENSQPQPWIESFRNPPYVGDIVNQEVVPYNQQDMIPVGFRTPLPTKDIADAWNQ